MKNNNMADEKKRNNNRRRAMEKEKLEEPRQINFVQTMTMGKMLIWSTKINKIVAYCRLSLSFDRLKISSIS